MNTESSVSHIYVFKTSEDAYSKKKKEKKKMGLRVEFAN